MNNMNKIFNSKRFDLFAKYIFIKYYILQPNTKWYEELYKNHILVFNGGWEYSNNKKTIDDFVYNFKMLIESISNIGYQSKDNSIEVNNKNILINNAHRFVTAYYFGFDVPLDYKSIYDGNGGYDYNFFSNRLIYGIDYLPTIAQQNILNSMELVWMKEMVLEASKLKTNIKVINIFPVADVSKDNEVYKLLSKNGDILYRTKIHFSKKGLYNYICELYMGETWIGYTRQNKADDTWGDNVVRFIAYIPNENCDIRRVKISIRSIYGNNNSVHINDTQEEAIRYIQSGLHSNYYLNNGCQLSDKNSIMFERYKKMMVNKNKEYLCIDSSFVMSFFGLREAKDLDFLHFKENNFYMDEDIHSHNNQAEYYDETIDDIILNPKLHFYVNGYKVANLDVIKRMKQNRMEKKDIIDVEIIELGNI